MRKTIWPPSSTGIGRKLRTARLQLSIIKKSNEGGGAGAQISYTGIAGLAFYGNYYYEQSRCLG